MREVKLYKCELCGCEYGSKIACEECEQNHKVKPKIKKLKHNPKGVNESGYPQALKVLFEDGYERIYELTGRNNL